MLTDAIISPDDRSLKHAATVVDPTSSETPNIESWYPGHTDKISLPSKIATVTFRPPFFRIFCKVGTSVETVFFCLRVVFFGKWGRTPPQKTLFFCIDKSTKEISIVLVFF